MLSFPFQIKMLGVSRCPPKKTTITKKLGGKKTQQEERKSHNKPMCDPALLESLQALPFCDNNRWTLIFSLHQATFSPSLLVKPIAYTAVGNKTVSLSPAMALQCPLTKQLGALGYINETKLLTWVIATDH